MRDAFFSRYEERLQKIDDKYSLDLDFRNYETFVERDLRLSDLPTIANATSIAGLALVLDGCRNISSVQGVNKIAVGRGLDLFDGHVARWLDQSSDMGAGTDALCDKLGMLAIGRAARRENALPKSFIRYVVAKNTLHTGLTLAAAINHPDQSFRPPMSGKRAMLCDNLAGGALLYANAYENEQPERGYHTNLKKIARPIIVAGLVEEYRASKTLIQRIPTV